VNGDLRPLALFTDYPRIAVYAHISHSVPLFRCSVVPLFVVRRSDTLVDVSARRERRLNSSPRASPNHTRATPTAARSSPSALGAIAAASRCRPSTRPPPRPICRGCKDAQEMAGHADARRHGCTCARAAGSRLSTFGRGRDSWRNPVVSKDARNAEQPREISLRARFFPLTGANNY